MLAVSLNERPKPEATFSSSPTSRMPHSAFVDLSFSSNLALPTPPSAPMNSPFTLKGPYSTRWPPGASACPAPSSRLTEHAHGVICSVLAHRTSTWLPFFSVTSVGHGLDKSRATAGTQFLKTLQACSSMLANSSRPSRSPILPCLLHCSSGAAAISGTYSEGCMVRCGNAGATTSMSAPVPVAISSAGPLKLSLSGSILSSAFRMGTRFRIALGWCCWPAGT
mmetsp:Transcript_33369/g.88278  ORF Transcript_33369/g.88278 Transcript_33369/m.88278 type:complete len:223 (-) Transcript_33369:149-817(-)